MSAQRELHRTGEASRLVDGGDWPLPAELTVESTRALGWAMKDLVYSSWSSEPQRAMLAARALRHLRDCASAAAVPSVLPEVDALVAWTDGIARVIQGEMEAAAASLDVAAAAFGELGQLRHAAQTQVPKIMALAMLGRHDDAAHCALAAQRALLMHGDLHAASKVSLNLGNIHLRSERYGAAIEHFREAAALFVRTDDPEHAVMADLGLGDSLTALGDFDEAARTYDRARSSAVSHEFPVLQALVEESVALLELVRGRYRQALAGLESARRRYAQLQMPQQLAIAEKQLADAYLELRLLPEALAGYDAALQRFAALGMEVDRGWTGVQRGRALALAGQRAASHASLAEAARIFTTLDNRIGGAAVTLAHAELALANSESAGALVLARDSAQQFLTAGLVERQRRAESVQAQALLQLGQVDAARALFDATLETACAHQLLPLRLRCLTGRAMAALAAGDAQAARVDLEAAVELFEDQRRMLAGDELRSAFQDDHLVPFQELLRLELQALEEGKAGAADVLAQLDRFRARTLADRLGLTDHGHDPDGRDGEGDVQRAEARNLRAHLAWLYRRLQRLNDEASDSTAVTAELRATEHELLERSRRMRLSAGPGSLVPGHAELDIAALQRALSPGDVLVEYGVLDDELFACVVTQAAVRVQRHLASWSRVMDSVRSVRFQIETLRHGSAPVQRTC